VFSLSLRDVELLLAERGIVVSYETVRRWCKQFGRTSASCLRRRRPRREDKWYLDEVFIRSRGVQLAADAYRALQSVAFDVWHHETCARAAT
jgi:transposase-like protein